MSDDPEELHHKVDRNLLAMRLQDMGYSSEDTQAFMAALPGTPHEYLLRHGHAIGKEYLHDAQSFMEDKKIGPFRPSGVAATSRVSIADLSRAFGYDVARLPAVEKLALLEKLKAGHPRTLMTENMPKTEEPSRAEVEQAAGGCDFAAMPASQRLTAYYKAKAVKVVQR